jgi:mono/diheme cytochrome c family protein
MTTKPIQTILLSSVLIFAGAMIEAAPAIGGQKAIYDNPLAPKMTPLLNVGKLNFDKFCASCHGASGRGTDKGPTFISRVYHPGHHGDAAFYIAAKRGVRAHHWPFGDMKPIPGITNIQIKSIIAYIRAMQKANGLF